MRILFTIALLMLQALSAVHELWLQPATFFLSPGEKLVVGFHEGENFMGEPWDLQKNHIEKLELQQLAKTTNLRDSVKTGEKDNLSYTIEHEGTYILSMQSNNAFVEMQGDEFNAYLKENGLDEVLDHRQKTNTLSSPTKEFYARYAKFVFQTGQKKDDTYKKLAGFPIEIVPDRNPYSLKVGDPIRFKILFDGKPVFGVRVKVWNRFDNRTTLQNIYTEKDGTLEARISNPGPWMVSVVRMVPSKQAGANWQSYWGSLVFGVDRAVK